MAENFGVTEKGFVLKRMDTILSEMQEDISDELGFDISANPQSVINAAIVFPLADKLAELWEVAQESYFAKYPSTAYGLSLDNACQYGNVIREPDKKTVYQMHCTGTDGTIVPKGSIVASSTSPEVRLLCDEDTEISRSACNSIVIVVARVIPSTEYLIKLNGVLYKYLSKSNDSEEGILRGLQSAIGITGYKISLNDKKMFLVDMVASRSNSIELSANLTTDQVTSIVHYSTESYGDIQLPNSIISKIITNVTGLSAVTNILKPTPGRLQQSDWELRQSFISKSFISAESILDSIGSYIKEVVRGVSSVRTYENDTDKTDTLGRPPHSIEVIVDGGDDNEIGKAILRKKPGGISTFGSIVQNISGKYGDVVTVRFNRPDVLYGWIRIEITTTGNVLPGYDEDVKRSILSRIAELSIGNDFMSQKYINEVYKIIPETQYCRIRVASSSNLIKPTQFVENNIAVSERQVLSISAERIEVVINGI